ncbi:hypothetical protein RO3G_08955 [Lichtheimia corymbifera JMRC:FSU:9682]|uniref:Large ribosomal subunit protein mL67 n=2 Tax=Lichtheimia TaxID=688353 RepID=A0A068SHE1_9FUNG|nr:uncharacterized protein O0I10_010214 [Lichtheimia ornata]KAJ8654138.1 hypothetical protein O0I10_010214 [Lichtheimia ornata]CDH61450.1 hypothetical protein RO3G_08955 [Lichtheimia corymbifera JMRC:FSU:9682]
MASTHSVYLFRHIQTNQVIVSTKHFAKTRNLRQLDNATRPVRLRKDLWRPMLALTGFTNEKSAQAVTDALLQRSKARQFDLKTSAEHLSTPKRTRGPVESDLVEKSVLSLQEALESVAPKHFSPETKLSALWEQPRFLEMVQEGKQWPAFVEHGQLELKNNRFVSA